MKRIVTVHPAGSLNSFLTNRGMRRLHRLPERYILGFTPESEMRNPDGPDTLAEFEKAVGGSWWLAAC